jgi:hypothetical protein
MSDAGPSSQKSGHGGELAHPPDGSAVSAGDGAGPRQPMTPVLESTYERDVPMRAAVARQKISMDDSTPSSERGRIVCHNFVRGRCHRQGKCLASNAMGLNRAH